MRTPATYDEIPFAAYAWPVSATKQECLAFGCQLYKLDHTYLLCNAACSYEGEVVESQRTGGSGPHIREAHPM